VKPAAKPIEVVWMTRAECGLPPAPLARMAKRPVALFGSTVHHTATPDPELHVVERWLEIYHEATSGALADHYVDTPYNSGVGKLRNGVGVVLEGRPNGVIGAHTRPIPGPHRPPVGPDFANLYTLGVALVGTKPTPEGLAALKAWLYVANVGVHAPLIFPHSFWDPTDCPSDEVRDWLLELHDTNVHLVVQ